jgi:hypothetical protein
MGESNEIGVANPGEVRYNLPATSGRSAVRLARLHGVQEVRGSIPRAPTIFHRYRISTLKSQPSGFISRGL